MAIEDLLVDVCCGPDATYAIEFFSQDYRVSLFFPGSNIHPEAEYRLRLEQVEKVAKHYGVPLHISPYEPEAWLDFVRGLEGEPEGGKRCEACFRFRFRLLAERALELGTRNISTTLTISPKKDPHLVNRVGRDVSLEEGLVWVEAILRKRGGFTRSLELSKELGLYRQRYCGCEFSRPLKPQSLLP
ncbi:MAG: epoxyqueuosine reductase QueH [candidate division WOR-3 bacterium]